MASAGASSSAARAVAASAATAAARDAMAAAAWSRVEIMEDQALSCSSSSSFYFHQNKLSNSRRALERQLCLPQQRKDRIQWHSSRCQSSSRLHCCAFDYYGACELVTSLMSSNPFYTCKITNYNKITGLVDEHSSTIHPVYL